MRDLLFPILSLLITIVGINGILSNGPEPYDFRKTIVKVEGKGHGSGSVVDSNLAKSLILTNRHVCDGITMSSEEQMKIHSLQTQLLTCRLIAAFSGEKDRCTELEKSLEKLMQELSSVGRKVTIMFNNHVIKSVKGIPTRVPGIIKHVSPDSDLCLVEIDHGQLPVIRLSKKRAKPGDHIFALGNPLFMTNHMTDGWVGDEMVYKNNTYQQHTAEIYGGSSGSPVVSDDGELVGINTLGTQVPTSSYMIPLEDVLMFLQGKLFKKVNMVLER